MIHSKFKKINQINPFLGFLGRPVQSYNTVLQKKNLTIWSL